MSLLRQLTTGLIEAGITITHSLFTTMSNIASTIWEQLIYPIGHTMIQASIAIGTALISATTTLITTVARGLSSLAQASWHYLIHPIGSALASGIRSSTQFGWQRIARPLGASGLNILGYAIEKALFGPPGLRAYADFGIFPTNVDYGKRYKLISDFGFDPYASIHPILDNLFGLIFGLGLGLYQYLNYTYLAIKHSLLSFGYNFIATANSVLGEYGVFNALGNYGDPRESIITRLVFGVLTAPAVLIASITSNTLDIVLTSLAHSLQSIVINSTRTFNVILGAHGTFGERPSISDNDRHVATRLFFGTLTSPIVAIIALATNAIDISCQIAYHTAVSTYHNIKSNYNQLGEYGVMGKRQAFDDHRQSRLLKGLFTLISSPIVLPTIMVSNIADLGMKVTLESARSIQHNVTTSRNLLGAYGRFGKRPAYQDSRSAITRISYGFVTLPITVPTALLTNTVDATASVSVHCAKSVFYQIQRHHNLLGQYGIMGDRKENQDSRSNMAQWVYGIMVTPVTLPINAATNTIDFIGAFTKNTALSYTYNTRYIDSLIRIQKKREDAPEIAAFSDPRPTAVIIIFSLFSAPLVIPSALVNYATLGSMQLAKNTALSVKHNVLASYNLLGEHGEFGPRQGYSDPRPSLIQRLIFGIIASPIVIPSVLLSNLADMVLSSVHHTALSVQYNTLSTFNLLGKHGVMGNRWPHSDTRPTALRVLFGIPSSLLVAPVILLTNTLDGLATTVKHASLSVAYNVQSTYHLLGQYGVMGINRGNQDTRHRALRIVFGTLTSPIVLALSTVANLVDITLSMSKQTLTSFKINFSRTHNIVLREHGLYGPSVSTQDTRNVFAQGVFGLTSLPFVVVASSVSNTVDCVFFAIKHSALSYQRNLHPNLNLLGTHGVLGPRQAYHDTRNILLRLLFGLITSPLVVASLIVSNAADVTLTSAHQAYRVLSSKKFWKTVGGLIGGAVAATIALPAFLVRRWVKSAYYLAYGYRFDTDPNARRNKKALANVATFGISALFFKALGYSSRFRSEHMNQGSDQVQADKKTIQEMIQQTKSGDLKLEVPSSAEETSDEESEVEVKNIDPSHEARRLLRIIGLKHDGEKILKAIDDQYRVYLSNKEVLVQQKDKTFHTFFTSKQGKIAIRDIKEHSGQEKDGLVEQLAQELDSRTQSAMSMQYE